MSVTDILNVCYAAGGGAGVASAWHLIASARKDRDHKAQVLERDQAIGEAIDKSLAPNNEQTAKILTRLTRIETDQFGPNHGGIREAVNKIDAKVDTLGERLSRVEGALEAKEIL